MGLENNIPEGWVESEIGLISNKITKGTTPSIKDGGYPQIGVNFLKAESLDGRGGILKNKLSFISEIIHEKFKRSQLEENDILFSMAGVLGRTAIIKKENLPANTNQALSLIRPDTAKILPKYLLCYLQQKRIISFVNNSTSQSAQPNINLQQIADISIVLPPLPEQKAIAKVLTAFDDKIELLQAQNKTLENMAQTIFKEWFGKYQVGDELPEGWRVGILDDLFGELATGNRPKGGVGNLSSGVPSIGAESIGGISNFDYSKTKYVSKEFFLNMKRGIVKEYDILIYKDGGTPGTFIPKFSMFGEGFPFKEFCINSHVFRVQPKKIHHRFYIYQWLNSYYCKWQLKNIGGKAAIPGINSTDLKNLDVIIPCDKLLYKYHDLVKNKYKKILKNMVQIQSLTKTRDTLLPKLMSGQVRVNNLKQTADA